MLSAISSYFYGSQEVMSQPLCSNRACSTGKVGELRCAKCGTVKYCSAECQKQDWKASHKLTCKLKAEESSSDAGKSAAPSVAPSLAATGVTNEATRVKLRDSKLPPMPAALCVDDGASTARTNLRALWTAACNGSSADRTALGFALSDEFSELAPDFAGACAWLRIAKTEGDSAASVHLAVLTMLGLGTPRDIRAARDTLFDFLTVPAAAPAVVATAAASSSKASKAEAAASHAAAAAAAVSDTSASRVKVSSHRFDVPGLYLAVARMMLQGTLLFKSVSTSAHGLLQAAQANRINLSRSMSTDQWTKNAQFADPRCSLEDATCALCLLYDMGGDGTYNSGADLKKRGFDILAAEARKAVYLSASDGGKLRRELVVCGGADVIHYLDDVELDRRVSSMYAGRFGRADADTTSNCAPLPRPTVYSRISSSIPTYACSAALGGMAGRPPVLDLALFYLGASFAEGRGTTRNYTKALAMFRAAAGFGNASAMRALAAMSRSGVCGPVDPVVAADWDAAADAAARRGWFDSMHADLQFAPVVLSKLFPPLAAAAVVELAETGCVRAQALAGTRLLRGHEDYVDAGARSRTEVDTLRGMAMLRAAAHSGHSDAARILGFALYDAMMNRGTASAAQLDEAIAWLRLAACTDPDSGCVTVNNIAESCFTLSVCLVYFIRLIDEGSSSSADAPLPEDDDASLVVGLRLMALEWADLAVVMLKRAKKPVISAGAGATPESSDSIARRARFTSSAAEIRAGLPYRFIDVQTGVADCAQSQPASEASGVTCAERDSLVLVAMHLIEKRSARVLEALAPSVAATPSSSSYWRPVLSAPYNALTSLTSLLASSPPADLDVD